MQLNWCHFKGKEDDHIGNLYIWATLNVERDQPEKYRRTRYQENCTDYILMQNLEDE